MCGIVGAVATGDVIEALLDGLRRLEYRGYDSAGIAVVDDGGVLQRRRELGKVEQLADSILANPLAGSIGIAHTRWATHGVPSQANAHPHVSGDRVAVVHNGIIENHQQLREQLQRAGFEFTSQTDTEVIAHQIEHFLRRGITLLEAVREAVQTFEGAYALGVISSDEPDHIVAARKGSPLVIGVARNGHYLASDAAALVAITRDMVFLEEGDFAVLTRTGLEIQDASGAVVERPVRRSELRAGAWDRGGYRHFMLKEIHEQPQAIAATLQGRIGADHLYSEAFGPHAAAIFDRVKRVHIIACGTSYHAGMVGRYWLEEIAGVPCQVEIASEFRYRGCAPSPDTLVITLSQSGETADTLEGLRESRRRGFGDSLCICNVPESSLVRESDLVLMTHAGPEIGVASTKAFTTQLVALMLVTIALGRRFAITPSLEAELIAELRALPAEVERVLGLDGAIAELARQFSDKHHALFLGRGMQYPVALEGALKLKEISYIHAEAYPAGELKHGPLALVDEQMPVIAVAPNDHLLEKLRSNIHEVHARGGRMVVFADATVQISGTDSDELQVLPVSTGLAHLAPVIYTIPLQLLAYHVAVIKGTDVDQPRNLAKSVTVE